MARLATWRGAWAWVPPGLALGAALWDAAPALARSAWASGTFVYADLCTLSGTGTPTDQRVMGQRVMGQRVVLRRSPNGDGLTYLGGRRGRRLCRRAPEPRRGHQGDHLRGGDRSRAAALRGRRQRRRPRPERSVDAGGVHRCTCPAPCAPMPTNPAGRDPAPRRAGAVKGGTRPHRWAKTCAMTLLRLAAFLFPCLLASAPRPPGRRRPATPSPPG